MRKQMVIGAACLTLAGGLALTAQDRTPDGSAEEAESILLRSLRPNVPREEFVASALRPLRQLDREGDGLDAQDLERQDRQRQTAARSRQISGLLNEDYDSDLKVSFDEIDRFAPGDAETRKRRAEQILRKYDTDEDGIATLKEAMLLPYNDRSESLAGLLAADRNSDGKVTAEELSLLASTIFDRFDSDGDGLISQEEFVAVSEHRRIYAVAEQMRQAGCTFPAAGQRTKVVGFGAYEGDAISSAYVGTPDEETSVIDVTIEAGSEPLYLLFTTYQPVIWRLTGSVERVEHVIASAFTTADRDNRASRAATSAVGIMGLPKSKVSITSRTCLDDIQPPREGRTSRNHEMAASRVKTLAGRSPDALFGEYSPVRISLPSGKVLSAPPGANARPQGFDAEVWREAARFWAGGLVRIDPTKVIAAEPVDAYRVLPSQMGLSQLVGAGAARKLDDGRFLIMRDIARIPPRMAGAHSATLILADGVKRPPGNASHGCVLTEAEAAAPNWREFCRPPAIQTVRSRPTDRGQR